MGRPRKIRLKPRETPNKAPVAAPVVIPPVIQSPEIIKRNDEERRKLGDAYRAEKELREEASPRTRITKKMREEAEAKRAADEQKAAATLAEKTAAAEAVVGVIGRALAIACERMPTPKPLTEFESEGFNAAATKVYLKYYDKIKWGEEVSLGFMLFMIFEPRLKKQKVTDATA